MLSLALCLAGPARGDSVSLVFDLSGSSIDALGGLISLSPTGAGAQATFNADVVGRIEHGPVEDFDSVTILPGPMSLDALLLAGPVDESVFDVTLTGSFASSLVGVAEGVYDGDNQAVVAPPSDFLLDVALDCSGGLCDSIATFPIDVFGVQTVDVPIPFELLDLDVPGQARLAGSYLLELGDFTAVLNLVGQETDRWAKDMNPIPEPGSFGLLAAGLAGLAARRRRSATLKAPWRATPPPARSPQPIRPGTASIR